MSNKARKIRKANGEQFVPKAPKTPTRPAPTREHRELERQAQLRADRHAADMMAKLVDTIVPPRQKRRIRTLEED